MGRDMRLTPPQRGDLVAILLGIGFVLLIATIIYVLSQPPSLRARTNNWGFGPGWECSSIPRGEPVCIKKAP
jgi:hypothetical protein